jgi:hypothetical protein
MPRWSSTRVCYRHLIPFWRGEGHDGEGQGQLVLPSFGAGQQVGGAVSFDKALVVERVEDVRQVAVGPERQRRVHHVEVFTKREVSTRIARVSAGASKTYAFSPPPDLPEASSGPFPCGRVALKSGQGFLWELSWSSHAAPIYELHTRGHISVVMGLK